MPFCRSCGAPMDEESIFCGACGQKVSHVSSSPAATPTVVPNPPPAPAAAADSVDSAESTAVAPSEPAALVWIPSSDLLQHPRFSHEADRQHYLEEAGVLVTGARVALGEKSMALRPNMTSGTGRTGGGWAFLLILGAIAVGFYAYKTHGTIPRGYVTGMRLLGGVTVAAFWTRKHTVTLAIDGQVLQVLAIRSGKTAKRIASALSQAIEAAKS